MDLNLTGKVAVVTGGSQGIGKAIAAELAAEGVDVAIIARGQDALDRTAAELNAKGQGRVQGFAADMMDPAAIDAVLDAVRAAFGQIDILVNNAGSSPMGRIGETADETWLKSLNLKLMGYVRTTRNVLPEMRARKWGRVINVIGRSGHQPRAAYTAGSAVNASLLSFTLAVAEEAAPDNVLVNGINPGPVQTGRWDTLVSQSASMDGSNASAANAAAIKSVGLGRVGRPEEISGMVAFLCSDRASFVSGTCINIDGAGTRCI